ncbi:hypothetical protein D9613_001072 [Agrocybe pediades]|uniref:Uncharacterized protein n=1 Tax=Agrocybe pediades TaxID=84607 RepID=A0A8H4VUY4_9AGAR|nr:hypothetical protein D9613_001072 [Agrocybe pediades]
MRPVLKSSRLAFNAWGRAQFLRPLQARLAYTSTVAATLNSCQRICLPQIPELHKQDFLDLLIPENTTRRQQVENVDEPLPKNVVMHELVKTAHRTFTAKGAPAYDSTLSPTLDAFSGIARYTSLADMTALLERAWKEDPGLTLRIIWNLRSIHDGKGEKEVFYRAFGWLYKNHPRTAISSLHVLVEPTCTSGKKNKGAGAHGYWKDLLNILALETVDELGNSKFKFLHNQQPRQTSKSDDENLEEPKELKERLPDPSRALRAQEANEAAKQEAAAKRKAKHNEAFEHLANKLSTDPNFRALYIAVARLFADRLIKDLQIARELETQPATDRLSILKQISLAGKWAPTPGGSHDRVTNIATAVSELIYASQSAGTYPSVLKEPLPDRERAAVLRSYYQRWTLTELRRITGCIEPLMAANRWTEIKYNRVPSRCMKNNMERFIKHDPEGFEKYLISVEQNKKTISGATLFPDELVAQAMALQRVVDAFDKKEDEDSEEHGKKNHTQKDAVMHKVKEFRKEIALKQLRVLDAQWKTLLEYLRNSGSIQKSIAVCDVSGSMGSFGDKYNKNDVQPIFPAVALSLVLASLSKPPFAGGFITFSATPSFKQVDLTKPLGEQVFGFESDDWGMTTNLSSVFLDLLLPIAIKNKVKQEDMIERLFVFTDMQFDESQLSYEHYGHDEPQVVQVYEEGVEIEDEDKGENENEDDIEETEYDDVFDEAANQREVIEWENRRREALQKCAAEWTTNYDAIEKAYADAGYKAPEIVFWDLAGQGVSRTVEATSDRKGVAMMTGFSPAMLKVFMEGEGSLDELAQARETEGVEKKPKEEIDPISVMRKALMVPSFDGLVVVD